MNSKEDFDKPLLLDIGCGTLVGGIPIIRYLEKSHYYLISFFLIKEF